jgi:hypothetical protein
MRPIKSMLGVERCGAVVVVRRCASGSASAVARRPEKSIPILA